MIKLNLLWFAVSISINVGVNIIFAVLDNQKVEFPTPNRFLPMLSNKPTTEEIVAYAREWSINRIKYGMTSSEDALSIVAEFEEWVEPEEDQLEILSLEERH